MSEPLRLDNGEIALAAVAFGASLTEIRTRDRTGAVDNVLVGLATPAAYRRRELNPHLGAIAGRYANRLGGASFPIGSEVHRVTANEGVNCLHGGSPGFSRREWEVVEITDASVTFELCSADGDQGFPGECTAQATYRLEGPALHIELSATCDAPTIVNLSNHAYWNLAGTDPTPAGPPAVGEHELMATADRYVPVDAEQIPTGAIDPVEGTDYDFRVPRSLGASRIDHCLVFGDDRRCELLHAKSGRRLTLTTDQPGVQIYTGFKLKPPHRAHGGVCMEAQQLPDAPNHERFSTPPLPSPVLLPGDTYRHHTVLEFGR